MTAVPPLSLSDLVRRTGVCRATGKVIMAFSAPALFEEVVRAGLVPLTRHTITSPALLADQLARVHSQGLTTESEETRLGYSSLAVPVYGSSGALAGALSITAPTCRTNVAKMSGAAAHRQPRCQPHSAPVRVSTTNVARAYECPSVKSARNFADT